VNDRIDLRTYLLIRIGQDGKAKTTRSSSLGGVQIQQDIEG
jgi:hypothetical protein